MAKSLDEIYAENYLGHPSTDGGLITEGGINTTPDEDTGDDGEPKQNFKPKSKNKKRSGKSKGGYDAGAGYAAESNTFDSLYSTFMEQFDDVDGGGDEFGFDESGDDTFEAEDDGMGEDTYTLSELRAMTLGELCDLSNRLSGGDDDGFEDDGFDDVDGDDEIPLESYGQTGGGSEHGAKGDYNGKAKRQPATSHVKGNGDANFGRQNTGYDPEDTEGSEGSEHGAQGDYSGKAKRQPATSHVKGNGDANFGKQNTGHRTSSGKKDKNYF